MMGLETVLVWVPAHIGVRGNERADKCTKKAREKGKIDMTVAFSKRQIKSIVKHKMKQRWQKQWEEEKTGRWYYGIQRQVGGMRKSSGNREEEAAISR